MLFAATLVTTGAAAFRFLVAPVSRGAGDFELRSRSRAAGLGALAAVVVLAAALVRAPVQLFEIRDPESPLLPQANALVFHTLWGAVWIGQLLLAIAAALNYWYAKRGMVGAWALAGWMSALLAFAPALNGHAIGSERLTLVAVLADGLHVLAAGCWLGTMLVLLAALRLPREAGQEHLPAAIVARYSPLALSAASLVVLSGLGSSLLHLRSFGDLVHTTYGQRLTLKLAAVGVMAGLGAWNWRKAGPKLKQDNDERPMRRSIGRELVVGAIVLLITSLLVVTAPPGED